MVKVIVVALGAILWAVSALAQDLGWVQIEARPSEAQALERAQAYAARLPNVNGFALPSGWYAIALGPYDRFTAEQELRRARILSLRMVTSSDNVRSLRFHLRRGWRLVRVHLDAMDRVREVKPQLPLIGLEDLPLRDIWELRKTMDPLPTTDSPR